MKTTISALGEITARRLRALAIGFAALTALMFAGTSNATIIWSVTGQVGDLLTGTDNEELAGAEISFSVSVEPGVYVGLFGGFVTAAPVSAGEITITGSGVAANNGTSPLEVFPGIVAPLVYLPNYCATAAADVTLQPVGVTLASGDFLSLAHSFCPSGVTDALPDDAISINHFPVGSPSSASFTAAVQNGSVSAQYDSTFAVYAREETGAPVPESPTLALVGLGLAGIGYRRRRKPLS